MPSNNEKPEQENKNWIWDHLSGVMLTSLVAVPMGLIRMFMGSAGTASAESTPSVPNLDLSLSSYTGMHEQMVCAAGRVLGVMAAVKHSNVGFMALGEIACNPLLFQGVEAPPPLTSSTTTTTDTSTTTTTTTTTETSTSTTTQTQTQTPTTTTPPTSSTITSTTTEPSTTTTTTNPTTTTPSPPTSTTTTEPTTTTETSSTTASSPPMTTTSISPPPPTTTATTPTTTTNTMTTTTSLPVGLTLEIINQGEIGVKSTFPSVTFLVGLSEASIGKLKKESNSNFNSASGLLTIKDTPSGVNATLHQLAFCPSLPGAVFTSAQKTLVLAASGNALTLNATWVYATGSLDDVYTSSPPTLTNASYPLQRLQLGESGRVDLKADPHFGSIQDQIIDYDCTMLDGSKCTGANIKNGIMVITASDIEKSTPYLVYARNWCTVSTEFAFVNVTIEHIAPSVVTQPISMTFDTGVTATVNLPVLFRGYKLKDFTAFLANGDLLPSAFSFSYSTTLRQLKMRVDENGNYTIVYGSKDDYDYSIETNATYFFKNIPPQVIREIPSVTILPGKSTSIEIPPVCTSSKKLQYELTQNGVPVRTLTWADFTPPTGETSGTLMVVVPESLIGQTKAFNLTCNDKSSDGSGINKTSFLTFIPRPSGPLIAGLPNKTIRAESTDSIKGIQSVFYSRSYPNASIIVSPVISSLQKWMTWNNIPGAQNIELNPNVADEGTYAVSLTGRDPAGNEVEFTLYVRVEATGWQFFVNWVKDHETLLSLAVGLPGGLLSVYGLYSARSWLYNFCVGKRTFCIGEGYVVEADHFFDDEDTYDTQYHTDDIEVKILKWIGAGNSWGGCIDSALGWTVSWSHYLAGKWNLNAIKLDTPWIQEVKSTDPTKTHLIKLVRENMPKIDYPIVLQVKHRDGRILAETNLNPRDLQLEQPLLTVPQQAGKLKRPPPPAQLTVPEQAGEPKRPPPPAQLTVHEQAGELKRPPPPAQQDPLLQLVLPSALRSKDPAKATSTPGNTDNGTRAEVSTPEPIFSQSTTFSANESHSDLHTFPPGRNSMFAEQRTPRGNIPAAAATHSANQVFSFDPPTRRSSAEATYQGSGLFAPPGMTHAEHMKEQALRRACGFM